MSGTIDARLVGRDVAVMEFDGESVLATYEDAGIRVSVRTTRVDAVNDDAERSRIVKYAWSVTFRAFKEAGSGWLERMQGDGMGNRAFKMLDAVGGDYIFGELTYTDFGNQFNEGAQMDDLSFNGTGPLYRSASDPGTLTLPLSPTHDASALTIEDFSS
jgi:hypothetical protein